MSLSPALTSDATSVDLRGDDMRIGLSTACVAIGILVGMTGCGSYSAPREPTMPPDSTGDTMPPAPNPPPDYNRN